VLASATRPVLPAALFCSIRAAVCHTAPTPPARQQTFLPRPPPATAECTLPHCKAAPLILPSQLAEFIAWRECWRIRRMLTSREVYRGSVPSCPSLGLLT